jgi:hypothetical protein
MDVIMLAIHFDQPRAELRANAPEGIFQDRETPVAQNVTAIFRHEYKMNVQSTDDASASVIIGLRHGTLLNNAMRPIISLLPRYPLSVQATWRAPISV